MAEKKKMSKKILTMIICLSLCLVLAVALIIYYFGNNPDNWNKVSSKEIKLAGLGDGFTPQGLCVVSETGEYMVSGYMKNKSDSRIYILNKESGESKYFTIVSENKDIQKGHLGGIVQKGNFVWISSDDSIITLSYSECKSVQNGGSVEVISVVPTCTNASFCFLDEYGLWVGEFYRPKNYETDKNHYFNVSETETNHAIATRYNFNAESLNGIESTPSCAVSLPDKVQGVAILPDGRIVLSTSYGLPNSKILIYSNEWNKATTHKITVQETEVDLFCLSSLNLQKTITVPSMAEGIVYTNGSLKILFENASKKYRLFTRNRIEYVMSISID